MPDRSVYEKSQTASGSSPVLVSHTLTYSFWLNQAENWFSRIQRDVISQGIFSSVKDLDKKLMRYIRAHNKNPQADQVEVR